MNPRAGFIRPTPLAGGPLRPLEYFSTQLKKHLGALQSAYQIIYEASELCQPEFSLILSHFFAPPGPHKMGCREAQNSTLSRVPVFSRSFFLKTRFPEMPHFRICSGITLPLQDHFPLHLFRHRPGLQDQSRHPRFHRSAVRIHGPSQCWQHGHWNPCRSS